MKKLLFIILLLVFTIWFFVNLSKDKPVFKIKLEKNVYVDFYIGDNLDFWDVGDDLEFTVKRNDSVIINRTYFHYLVSGQELRTKDLFFFKSEGYTFIILQPHNNLCIILDDNCTLIYPQIEKSINNSFLFNCSKQMEFKILGILKSKNINLDKYS